MLDIDLQSWIYFFAGHPVYALICLGTKKKLKIKKIVIKTKQKMNNEQNYKF